MWSRYMHLLNTRPILTKSLTAGTLSITSDALAQRIQFEQLQNLKRPNLSQVQQNPTRTLTPPPPPQPTTPFQWDHRRSLRMAFYASAISAPLGHLWFKSLDRYVGSAKTLPVALKKVALDQLLIAAPFTCLFISSNMLLAGRSLDEIREKVDRDLMRVVKANWVVWPAAMLINFRFVPLQARVLFGNGVGLGWGVFMSLMQHDGEVGKTEGTVATQFVHPTMGEPRLPLGFMASLEDCEEEAQQRVNLARPKLVEKKVGSNPDRLSSPFPRIT